MKYAIVGAESAQEEAPRPIPIHPPTILTLENIERELSRLCLRQSMRIARRGAVYISTFSLLR